MSDVHGLEVGVVFDQRQFSVKCLRVGHDVLDRLQLGHIHAGLCRHVQVGVAGAQPQLLVAGNGAAHAAFAPVVGSQGQVPVAKHPVELLQVVQRCAGGRQHVAAVVAEGVLLEVEIVARGRHELPHACGLGARYGLGIERAFDVRQQCQLGGHAPAFQLFNDVEQVFAGPLRHALHVVRAGGIPLLAVLHQLVLQVGHGKAAPDAVPQVGRGRQRRHLATRGLRGGDGFERAVGYDRSVGGGRGFGAGGAAASSGLVGH